MSNQIVATWRPAHLRHREAAIAAHGAGCADVKVPMLVLYGEWLKAIAFPIGAAAYLTADLQGEIRLARVGLRLPRRLRILATPRSADRAVRGGILDSAVSVG